MTVAEYVRATAMKTPPRKRPARERTLAMLQYELNSIATNLAQLEAATGETNFGAWAKFVGKDLIERTTDRKDLTALIERGGSGNLNNWVKWIFRAPAA